MATLKQPLNFHLRLTVWTLALLFSCLVERNVSFCKSRTRSLYTDLWTTSETRRALTKKKTCKCLITSHVFLELRGLRTGVPQHHNKLVVQQLAGLLMADTLRDILLIQHKKMCVVCNETLWKSHGDSWNTFLHMQFILLNRWHVTIIWLITSKLANVS